jgi:myo-inositol-1(or 4)-monophosphatase
VEDLERVLSVADAAARAGGDVALARAHDVGYLQWKAPRDVFIEAALDVQKAVVETIRHSYPEHAILAEEGPDDEVLPLEADPLWIVDPICGSMNYLQHDPHYAVCVGYREADFWQVGVVYEPARGHLYSGLRGERARLDGQVLAVHQFADGNEAIERALVCVDLPGGIDARRDMQLVLNMAGSQVMGVRALGSPALGLCGVASGRFHGYLSMGLKLWDLAPASVILQAAGGVLTDGGGASWLHSADGSCIASNATTHGRLLSCFQPLYAMRRVEAERAAAAARPGSV